MSEFIGGVSLKSHGGYLCVDSGWDCADLQVDEARELRDYLNEWLEQVDE